MNAVYFLLLAGLLVVLALAAYVDRVYSEMGKFLSREFQDNIDAWEQAVEPRLRLGRESIVLSASVLRQLTLALIALLIGMRLYAHTPFAPSLVVAPNVAAIARTIAELVLLILIFDRVIPQILFARTRGLWAVRLRVPLQVLFYLVLPVTLLLGLLLSIVALAEPEDTEQPEDASEAMDALLEAGEEEGILEESDRELVRSVVEFGDKLVREVMTPRPEVFAVPEMLTLEEFTAAIEEHAFSRVPVYGASLDEITGIAFAHDLLQVPDTEAATRTMAEIVRPAAFVPETKNVAELLREMQREKQHMRVVIDEYGAVAGLVTIEDLLEAIVGEIDDEHDSAEPDDAVIEEADGSLVLSGGFEVGRLRDLLREQARERPSGALPHAAEPSAAENEGEFDPSAEYEGREDPALHLVQSYGATTLGGLVSEMAGHIPLPGEVVVSDGVRLEVLAATDRRIDRIRVTLTGPAEVASREMRG